ncbi:MAG TPA: helix-turn-helix domain-containing protein [Solirubrobacteraceae bacterium]
MSVSDFAFSTSVLAKGERLAALSTVVNRNFLTLQLAPLAGAGRSGEVAGAIAMRELGGITLASFASFAGSPISARRTPQDIQSAGEDHYMLALHVRGLAHVRQGARAVELAPGDLTLLDSALPYAIELTGSGAFGHIALKIPRTRMDGRIEGLERLTALRVARASAVGSLLSPYLQTLAAPSWRASRAAAEPLIESGLDLLAGALAAAGGVNAPPAARGAELRRRLERHILAGLGDPALSPATVAAANNVSLRQAQRLFAHQGTTLGRWIREQRLAHCRRALEDPRLGMLPIAAIASRWGFVSAAHFSRVFTERYGLAPSEVRRAALVRERQDLA